MMRRLSTLAWTFAACLAAARGHAATPTPTPVSQSDDFGYQLASVAFSYTDISSLGTAIAPGSWLGSADDGSFQLSLPFNFKFYGASYNKVNISSNGYLQFGSASAFSAPNCLSGNLAPSNIVAAYWCDLDPGSGGSVTYLIQGSPGSQVVIVQFTGVLPRTGPGSLSFQVLLNESDNSIEVRYLSTSTHDSGASAASGLRSAFDCPNRSSLPFSCLSPDLVDGLALLYSYPSLEPACGTPTQSPTFSVSPTVTPTPSISPTPTHSPSPTVTRTAVAQSDAFGYSALSTTYAWIDISSSGSPVSAWSGGSDDGSFIYSFPVGMLFKFYGSSFSKVSIATNGYLQFGTSSADFGTNCLATNTSPAEIIALYWQDLDPGAGGQVYTQILGSPGSRVAVIQFEQVALQSGPGTLSAEALLFEGTNQISLRYKDTASVGSGQNAVVGLRSQFDCPNRTSLPISCNQAVIGSLSQIDFNYPSPDPSCGSPTVSPSFSVSPSFTLSFTDSPTPTASGSFTPSLTSSPTSTASPSFSVSPTVTDSFTPSPSFSDSPTPSPSVSVSPSFSVSPTLSPSFTTSQTFTNSPSATPSATASPTFTNTPSATVSSTVSPSFSASPSFSVSPSSTMSPTLSPSFSVSPTQTLSLTPSPSWTASQSFSATPSNSPSPTLSGTPTLTATVTLTATSSATPTSSFTASPTVTNTPFPPATKPACAVLGEPDFSSTSGLAMGAASLSQTSGVAIDLSSFPFRLYVADTVHHRVLIWNDAGAISNGGPADGVIGQANFSSALANAGGPPGAGTLSTPLGMDVDPSNGDLWVADSGNHRVLRFSKPIPLNGALASRVLGQGGSFSSAVPNSGGVSAQSLLGPSDVSIDAQHHLAVADTGNHRALYFDISNSGDSALNEWGQASMAAALPNRGGAAGADSLLNPAGVLATATDLWVSDTGNHRILRFGLTFISSTASLVLGQANFTATSANQGAVLPGANSLNTPLGLSLDPAQRIYVADSLNHRVLAYAPPYAAAATLVYGQAGFALGNPSSGNDRMNVPRSIRAGSSGNLLVADSLNERLMFYGCSSGVGAATATPSATQTHTPSATKTSSPTQTSTFSFSPTATPTPSWTATPSFSVSPTQSLTATISATSTLTATPSVSFTASPTPSATSVPTLTQTPYLSPTLSPYPHPQNAVLSYPNPANRASGKACLAFPPGNRAEAVVYDMLLQEVRRLDPSLVSPAQGLACWDLKNSAGELLAPGIYYLRVVVDGKAYLSKMTVI